jgi:hypothetical protein
MHSRFCNKQLDNLQLPVSMMCAPAKVSWRHTRLHTPLIECQSIEADVQLESIQRSAILSELTLHRNVANMASYVISLSMILVIHDDMINGTNHIV